MTGTDLSTGSASGSRWRRHRVSAPGLVAAAVLLAGLVLMVFLVRPLYFFFDDWSFLLRRSLTHDTLTSLFHPHNEHWVTLPVIEFRVLFALFGLGHYLPYALVTVLLHLVACGVLYLVLRRAGTSSWVSVVVLAFAVFLGVGASDILWAFQAGFTGSVVFGLLAHLAADTDAAPSRRRTVLTWVLLVASLMCSGVGIAMVVWVAARVAYRRGIAAGAVVAVVPALVYLVWYAAIGHVAGANTPVWDETASLFLVGVFAPWEHVLPAAGTGAPILLGLLVGTLVGRTDERLRGFAVAGFIALGFDYTLIALSRGVGGPTALAADRYVYIAIFLTLPALAMVLDLLWRALFDRALARAVTFVVVAALAIGMGAGQLRNFQQDRITYMKGFQARLVAASQLARSGEVLVRRRVDPTIAPDIEVSDLPLIRGYLPNVAPSRADRMEVSANLQMTVSRRRLPVPLAPFETLAPAPGVLTTEGGCVKGSASAPFSLGIRPSRTGGQFSIRTAGDELTLMMTRRGDDGPRQAFPIAHGKLRWVATSAPRKRLVVTVPAGAYTLCASEPTGTTGSPSVG